MTPEFFYIEGFYDFRIILFMKRGFTLVELSIVLVIIGLLIGGILSAQSMLSTARVQSFVRQIQQFDAAVLNFKTKYNGLPGDTLSMGCVNADPLNKKCGNNIIDCGFMACCSNSERTHEFNWEEANFWPHLQRSGFMAGGPTFSPTISGGLKLKGAVVNAPEMKIGKGIGALAYYNRLSMSATDHYYLVSDFRLMETYPQYTQHQQSIPAIDVLAIDKKMDDGLAANNATSVINDAYFTASPTLDVAVIAGEGQLCSNGTNYYTTRTAKCAIVVKMLSTVGN